MKRARFVYRSAVNGLEAVQRVESETFDAIIMGKSRVRPS
jgi:CheY-like chemotaxis protein